MTEHAAHHTPSFKGPMIKVGDFFFKWRNQAFPLMLIAAFIAIPPSHTLFGRTDLEPWRDALAVGLVVAGLALRALVIGFAYIKRGGVGKKVYAADLVTSGMFGVCRNPLYVGNLLTVLGVLVMHGDPRVLIAGAAIMGFIYQSIVYAEERFLDAKFGEGYRAYCADVPRWGFRLSRFSDAVAGMRFNFRKSVLADYATWATSAGMLIVTEIYEQFAHPADPPSMPVVWTMAALFAAFFLWTLAIRLYKKRRAALPAYLIARKPSKARYFWMVI